MVSPSTTSSSTPTTTADNTGSTSIDSGAQEWQWLMTKPVASTTNTEVADPVNQIQSDLASSLTTDSQEPLTDFGTFTMVESIEPE